MIICRNRPYGTTIENTIYNQFFELRFWVTNPSNNQLKTSNFVFPTSI